MCAARWAAAPPRVDDYDDTMTQKFADYLGNIATLIVNSTIDLPELSIIGCDLQRMPNMSFFPRKRNGAN